MYTREHGDMWSAWTESDLFLMTSHSCVENGSLIMQAGIAKEARLRFPGLAEKLGCRIDPLRVYGLLVSDGWPERKLGLFQTHCHPASGPLPLIIHIAADYLAAWCRKQPERRVDLSCPATGRDGLSMEDVRTLLRPLPADVHLWKPK